MVAITSIDITIMVFYSISCVSFLTAGVIFMVKSRDKPKIVRNYLLGVGSFFLLYGVTRVMMFLFEATFPLISTDFVWNISAADFKTLFVNNPDIELYHEIIWRLTTGIGTLGLIILMYELELHIVEKKTKFIFTLIAIITVIPALIFGTTAGKDDVSIIRIILYLGNALVVVIPLFYFYLAVKTSGEPRRNAIGAGIGMLLTFLGVVFNSSIGKSLFTNIMITYILYGSLVFIGIFIYLRSIKYD